MVDFRIEPFSDRLYAEVLPLLKDHYRELRGEDGPAFSPDTQRYWWMANNGLLRIATAYDGKTLVGYCVNLLSKGLHYSETIYAGNDIFYLKPDYRKGTTALSFIDFVERDLATIGVHVSQWHVKPNPDFSPLLRRRGYHLLETIWEKNL